MPANTIDRREFAGVHWRHARSYLVSAHTLNRIIPERKVRLMSQDAACDGTNLIGLAAQETYRGSPAAIYVAVAVGGLVVTVAWVALLLYGAWRFIDWIAA